MTKEELRKRILELYSKADHEDSEEALEKMCEEADGLCDELSDILYYELERISARIVVEKIIDRDCIDLDLLVSEYLEDGDLEGSFVKAAEECDGIDMNYKIEILKRYD